MSELFVAPPPSLLPGDEQPGAPSLGGSQYYHPTSLTSQTPTVTRLCTIQWYIPLCSTLHHYILLFLQNNIFLCRILFLPSLAPSPSHPGCPKIFVSVTNNKVRADFHHNNYNWERQEIHPFVLSNFKMSQQSLSVSFLAGTRPSSNTDQDTFQMQQNGNQENVRVSDAFFRCSSSF